MGTGSRTRVLSHVLLRAYLSFALVAALWRVTQGSGSAAVIAVYASLLAVSILVMRATDGPARIAADWLPLVSLPILYVCVPWSIVYTDGRLYDAFVQGWDRAIFGTEPPRRLAGVYPFPALSELLHAAYLSYYPIIYVPPILMYRARWKRGFDETVLAFTVGMVACFGVFCLFPVAGPRFVWTAPDGVPDGPVRSLALLILERGSSRGTAFPSSHMAIALCMSLSSIRWRGRFGSSVLAMTVLLGFGAVYGGFHYATDMLVGAIVGVAGWGAAILVSGQAKAATA